MALELEDEKTIVVHGAYTEHIEHDVTVSCAARTNSARSVVDALGPRR